MSQSKHSYGVQDPKDSARARNGQHDSSRGETATHSATEPACRSRAVGHSVENREWREVAYNERRLVSYEPCAWPECFPDGPPDADDIETVVRSTHQPTKYHRPRTTATDAQSRKSTHEGQAVVEHEVVGAITDLCEGERVVWEGQRWTMRVVEGTTDPDGVVFLTGSNGGEYRIEGRPNAARPYAVYPAVGLVEELCRVVPISSQSRCPEPKRR